MVNIIRFIKTVKKAFKIHIFDRIMKKNMWMNHDNSFQFNCEMPILHPKHVILGMVFEELFIFEKNNDFFSFLVEWMHCIKHASNQWTKKNKILYIGFRKATSTNKSVLNVRSYEINLEIKKTKWVLNFQRWCALGVWYVN